MTYKNYIKGSAALVLLILFAFRLPERKIRVYLIGDSTISIKQTTAYPETGWGMPFVNFFDAGVQIENRAQNGRSTKTFVAENRWQPVVDSLQKGDYVFIQFGHNDEVPTKASYTPIGDYRNYLIKFISETKSKGGNPVLITPVSRRKFDANGTALDTHQEYAAMVRNIAGEQHVPLIDLDQKSIALLQKLGVENSKMLFNQLQPGEHPNYPEGKIDDTHFNELGAREMAQLVLKEIHVLNLDLVNHIVKPVVKK
ncbi:rhamnogalacturonan acetylesterase [Pedobacter duraquae]|nr:rhamnogalacturonan acetylesterase [Pedobacter duraquae]